MEFVIATFPQSRGLRMDGAPQGQTNQMIAVQRGHHIFDLGVPADYAPPSVAALVMGGSQSQPMQIAFAPLAVLAAVRDVAAPPKRRRRPKASKKSKGKPKKKPTPRLKKGAISTAKRKR